MVFIRLFVYSLLCVIIAVAHYGKEYNIMIPINQHRITDFCKKNDIAFLGVLGSASRNDFGTKSDVDILVRYARPKGLFEHSGVALALESLFGRKVDLVTDRALSKYIRTNVYRDLKPLYGRQNS